jgi:hypothetical protein
MKSPSPTSPVSTHGNSSTDYSARHLIRDLIMRLTTPFVATALVAATLDGACVGDVGDRRCKGRACDGSGTDGSGSDHTGSDTNCEQVTHAVSITSPSDFDTLPKGCWDLYAPLTIQGSQVTSLAKLGDLIGIDSLEIIGTGLTTLDAPKPLHVYGAILIEDNTSLTNLKNMIVEKASNLLNEVIVDNNAQLASIDGLSELTMTDGNFTVTRNPKLASASLFRLTQVGGALRISDNAALTSLDASRVELVGRVEIINDTALTSFQGLTASTISGDVILRGNRALTSLGTMSSLSQIGGSVTIDDNDALTDIAAFTTSMQYVNGSVIITNNGALTGLGQISHFFQIGALNISSNPNLSFCRAREVAVCVNVPGAITIQNNKSASGCNSWCGN